MTSIYWLHSSDGGYFGAYTNLDAARKRGSELAKARDEAMHIVAVPILETIASPLTEQDRAERATTRAERATTRARDEALAEAYLETLDEDRRGMSARFYEASLAYRDAFIKKLTERQKVDGIYY